MKFCYLFGVIAPTQIIWGTCSGCQISILLRFIILNPNHVLSIGVNLGGQLGHVPPIIEKRPCIYALITVTFRPRSTGVAVTSNAEGFACCCRAANDEDGYRVGAGQGFELTAVAVGHLGRNATWPKSTLGLFQ